MRALHEHQQTSVQHGGWHSDFLFPDYSYTTDFQEVLYPSSGSANYCSDRSTAKETDKLKATTLLGLQRLEALSESFRNAEAHRKPRMP